MAALEFIDISKSYGTTKVLDRVSLKIDEGEFFSLLGPSGCGKTTLLRLVAGFDQPDSGQILLDGQELSHLPPNKRPVNTVFQSYALFPHLSVYENVAFGLRVEGVAEAEIQRRVEAMLALIQMQAHEKKLPNALSGGQKQRVAIARALVKGPRVLLLDEPLAALDLKLRQKMLFEIDLIQEEVGTTFVFVTHDQGEAMAVSDRIALLNQGRIEQVGTPMELYEAPTSSFVAAFIGDTNFLDGTAQSKVDTEYLELEIDGLGQVLAENDSGLRPGELVHLSVRPEKMHVSREEPSEEPHKNRFQGVVEDVVYQGDHTKFWVRVQDYRFAIIQQHSRFLLDRTPISWEEKVWVWWHADDGYMLERYRAADEAMTELPPENIGEEEQ